MRFSPERDAKHLSCANVADDVLGTFRTAPPVYNRIMPRQIWPLAQTGSNSGLVQRESAISALEIRELDGTAIHFVHRILREQRFARLTLFERGGKRRSQAD